MAGYLNFIFCGITEADHSLKTILYFSAATNDIF